MIEIVTTQPEAIPKPEQAILFCGDNVGKIIDVPCCTHPLMATVNLPYRPPLAGVNRSFNCYGFGDTPEDAIKAALREGLEDLRLATVFGHKMLMYLESEGVENGES